MSMPDDFAAREIERQRTMVHETLLPDPSSGLPLRHAMTCYADQEGRDEYVKLAMRGMIKRGTIGSLTDNERSVMLSLRLSLVTDQLLRLRYGWQRATAFAPGSLTPAEVPAEWWHLASVDIDANTAEANGTRLSGILIYAGANAGPAASPTAQKLAAAKGKKRGPKTGKYAKARQGMRDAMLAGETEEGLRAGGLKGLAHKYGLKSHSDAGRALKEAVADFGENYNSAKFRKTPNSAKKKV
jgi:hypothetical protein